ncbi:S-adenosylmethionine decarboxylase [Phaffia rhodozyma]|uniref:S-adenosylmethionine decarboxylase n=1 Tax=Phaffia rhodozyma TaxID=264483 RepID=A0A0F7SXR5_PHARH|nr:S-adenosylmethionine decarboxylase [Phaffia rhodozyma]
MSSDSSSSDGPFEGPEKLLEIWFSPNAHDLLPSASASTSGPSSVVRPPHPNPELQWSGLRRVPREVWEEMLDLVKCKILSFVEGEEIDTYLLSESSLIVSSNRLILKTCGTTLNLLGLPRILSIAREYAGFNEVYRCFYSRKSFMFPERQKGVHASGWRGEVAFLDGVFDNGSAYTVGPMNGDHWLLYVTAPRNSTSPQTSSPKGASYAADASVLSDAISSAAMHLRPASPKSPSSENAQLPPPQNHTKPAEVVESEKNFRVRKNGSDPAAVGDQTLEILMTHLSEKGRNQFYPPKAEDGQPPAEEGYEGGKLMSDVSELSTIFPSSLQTLDSYAFSPCGYSANALVRAPTFSSSSLSSSSSSLSKGQEGYWTVHVTPEADHSFASFETNISLPLGSGANSLASSLVLSTHSSLAGSSVIRDSEFPNLLTLVRKVVGIFEPGRFSITLFVETNKESLEEDEDEEEEEEGWGKTANILGSKGLVPGYRRKDRIGYEFEGYDLIFCCFEKIGWVEGQQVLPAFGTFILVSSSFHHHRLRSPSILPPGFVFASTMAPGLFKRRDSSNLSALAQDPAYTTISNVPEKSKPSPPFANAAAASASVSNSPTRTPVRSSKSSFEGSIPLDVEGKGAGVKRKTSLFKRLGFSGKDHESCSISASPSTTSLSSNRSKPPPSASVASHSLDNGASKSPLDQHGSKESSPDSDDEEDVLAHRMNAAFSGGNGKEIGRKSMDGVTAPVGTSLLREDVEPSTVSSVKPEKPLLAAQLVNPASLAASTSGSDLAGSAQTAEPQTGESVWTYQSEDEDDSEDENDGFATPDEGLSEVGEESDLEDTVDTKHVAMTKPSPSHVHAKDSNPVEAPTSLVDTSVTGGKLSDRGVPINPIPKELPRLREKDQDQVLKEDLQTCHRVMNLFLSSHIKEAEKIVQESDPKRERLYLQIADCILSALKGLMTFEPSDLQHAQAVTKYVTDLVSSYRKPASSLTTRLFKGGGVALIKSMTDIEKHAELMYAETLLMKSMLGIIVGGEWLALIKEAMNMRTSQGIYRTLNTYIEAADKSHGGHDPTIDRDLRSGVELGTGMSALMLSMMPGKVVKIAEVFGFQGSRRYALDKLAESGGWTSDSDRPAVLKDQEGVRRPLSDMCLMLFHLVISSLLPVTDVDVKFGEKIMWYNVERFPRGVFSLFFQARLHVMQDQPHKSSIVLHKAIEAQHDYIQLQLLSRWDIGTNALALNDFQFAAECFDTLYLGSNWSKATYLYSTAAAMCEVEKPDIEKITEYMTLVPKSIKKVVGKSLPVEKYVSRKSRKFLAQGRLAIPGVELSYVFGLYQHTPVWAFQQKTLPRIQLVIDELEATTPETYKGGEGYWDDFALAHMLRGVALGLIALPNPDRVVSPDDPPAEPVDEAALAVEALAELQMVLDNGRKLVLDHWIVFFTHYEIGGIYDRQGRIDEALQHYNLVLSGKHAEADLNKATGKYSLQNGVTLKCTAAIQSIKERQRKGLL